MEDKKKAELVDWNKFTIEQYIEHLEEKFRVDSSGTAKAVFELITAYKKLKQPLPSTRYNQEGVRMEPPMTHDYRSENGSEPKFPQECYESDCEEYKKGVCIEQLPLIVRQQAQRIKELTEEKDKYFSKAYELSTMNDILNEKLIDLLKSKQ